jgi:predicted NodU family carbamoyl transferase
MALTRRARKLGARLGLARPARGKFGISQAERLEGVTEHLGAGPERIVCLDHHACHAAAAYFGSPFAAESALVLTNDNSGDGLCATVSTGRATSLQRHEATPAAPGSLGSFYSLVTVLLGMTAGEHEYKVMGLAPYASAKHADRAAAALARVFGFVEGQPCLFAWRERGPRYHTLLEATLGLRFDGIAGGAQRIVEESLLAWSRVMHARYGGDRLALGGGVFMNVKANMHLASEEWVRDLFAFPSCGDESNAVGAAYLGYLDLCGRAGGSAPLRARLSRARNRRRRGRGGDEAARPLRPLPSVRARVHRGEDRRPAGGGRRRGALCRPHGIRRPSPRESLDPGEPGRSPRGDADQPHDQEP